MKRIGFLVGILIALLIALIAIIVVLVLNKLYLWACTVGVILGFFGYVLIRFLFLLRKQTKDKMKSKGEV